MTEMSIDNRKDLIMLLLYVPGKSGQLNEPIMGRTRLMKIMFLFNKEVAPKIKNLGQTILHEFKPYHFGPFSRDVFDDIQFLENVGLVEEDPSGEASMAEISELRLFYDEALIGRVESEEASDETYSMPIFRLTEPGIKFAEKLINQLSQADWKMIQQLKYRYNSVPIATLLRYVYKSYPDMAIESKIRDTI